MSLGLEKGRASVTSRLEPIERQRALDGLDEPDFAYAGTFVNREFTKPVMASGGR